MNWNVYGNEEQISGCQGLGAGEGKDVGVLIRGNMRDPWNDGNVLYLELYQYQYSMILIVLQDFSLGENE